MKELIVDLLSKHVSLEAQEIAKLLEIPKDSSKGDYAFPCFALSKEMKKSPNHIALDLASKIRSPGFEKIEASGPYLNFFINRSSLAQEVLAKIIKEKNNYGSSKIFKSKTLVIEMSSPNVAKPFGIGHLRSTIIGNSLAEISSFLGFKVIKINYLGDWGTPFGKIISGYMDFGSTQEFKKNPIKHLYEIYVKTSQNLEYEQKARDCFKKMESQDKKIMALWKKFRSASLEEFNKIYSLLGIKFDVLSAESEYRELDSTVNLLEKKGLLKESEGALIVDLEKFNLGVCLIKKSDGTTLYSTRDIAAALDRHKKYKFQGMLYEVGSEQKLYFRQLFKVLELLGNGWAKDLKHVEHGLYLDKDGKKFATRKGKTFFMESIFQETKDLAKIEIKKRESQISEKALEERAGKIALAAIFYGDLKNYRSNDMVFDIERFLSFEGDTGPYLLYTYARAKSILKKSQEIKDKFKIENISEKEKALILHLDSFPKIVREAYSGLNPSIIAHYAYHLSQAFNEFYHSEKVIGSKDEPFKLALVSSVAQVLKNSLSLLGIQVIEKM